MPAAASALLYYATLMHAELAADAAIIASLLIDDATPLRRYAELITRYFRYAADI